MENLGDHDALCLQLQSGYWGSVAGVRWVVSDMEVKHCPDVRVAKGDIHYNW